jgi:nucleoside-triphosphatase THEP1
MSRKDLVSINPSELKEFLGHIITNNRYLQENGKGPVSVEVIGESGIGKTSSIVQLADELGLNFVKLNLAQIEEIGDLVGFPIRQFEMTDGKDTVYVDEHLVEDYRKENYKATGKNRMSYCAPEWIANKDNGGILLLDDWNRADSRFIQAVMELIDRQTYISWTLPKDWHIILTANPDNGDYLVNSIDNAQKTRFISVNLKFDMDCWAKWAEQNDVDGRCINFMLMNPELINTTVNSRSAVMFFNSISSIKSFEDSLPLIQMIGEGSVGSEFSSMFTMFINNKLDKMITPQAIMDQDEKYVLGTLKSLIDGNNGYRADIAATLSTRMVNYLDKFANENKVEKPVIERIKALVKSDIFTKDIVFNMVKGIYNSNPKKYQLMLLDKEMSTMVLK